MSNIYIGYKWYVPKEEYDKVEEIVLEQDKTIREYDRKNKQITKDIMELKQTIANKEYIIDKAIEYIENKNEYLDSETYYQVFEYRELYLTPLLKILKGEENE